MAGDALIASLVIVLCTMEQVGGAGSFLLFLMIICLRVTKGVVLAFMGGAENTRETSISGNGVMGFSTTTLSPVASPPFFSLSMSGKYVPIVFYIES